MGKEEKMIKAGQNLGGRQHIIIKTKNVETRNPKIVDIGGGQNPHPSAGVIVDKYIDNVSRGKDIVIPSDAKFMQADVEDLPLGDKEFDYSYAKHILEHVTNPAQACKEIMRVSKGGYIETPTALWEVLFGRGYHLWLVEAEGNKLIFTKKNNKNCPPNKFGGDWLYTNCKPFNDMFVKNIDLFYVRFHWKDRFEVEIRNG